MSWATEAQAPSANYKNPPPCGQRGLGRLSEQTLHGGGIWVCVTECDSEAALINS